MARMFFAACMLFCVVSCASERSPSLSLTEKEKAEGFEVLFDGADMDQWEDSSEYVMEDGNIVMRPTRPEGGNLYTKRDFVDFVLRFEFLLPPAGNNGLGIRHTVVKEGYSGMELQILDNGHPNYKDLKEWQYHGSVYGYIAARRGALRPAGEWNCQEVVADGANLKVTLNGTVILDCNLVEGTKHLEKKDINEAIFRKTGRIAFLGHGDPVKFRNIRIRVLKDSAEK